MKKDKFFRYLIPIVMVIISIALLVFGFNYKEPTKEYTLEESLVVASKFTVSTPSSIITSRNDNMVIGGRVENISNNDIQNIVFKFSVKTPITDESGEFAIIVDEIKAGEVKVVTQTIPVTKHYTQLTNISFSVDGGNLIDIENVEYTPKQTFMVVKPLCLIGGAVVLVLAIMLTAFNISKEKAINDELLESIDQTQYDNIEEKELYDLQTKLNKEKIKKELEEFENNEWFCSYCGAKNGNKSSKCSTCGANKDK